MDIFIVLRMDWKVHIVCTDPCHYYSNSDEKPRMRSKLPFPTGKAIPDAYRDVHEAVVDKPVYILLFNLRKIPASPISAF